MDNEQLFGVALDYLKLLLGMLIFLPNSLIFGILVTKKKKKATDYLILSNLLMDAIYGLQMCCVASVTLLMPSKPYLFLLALFLEYALIFSSLSMLVVMSLNRYVAVVKPFR